MNEKTLETLDYFRIRDNVAGFCCSEEGEATLKERTPFTSFEKYGPLKEQSREWASYLNKGYAMPFAGWPACAELFDKMQISGINLQLDELYAVALFCKAAEGAKNAFGSQPEKYPNLCELTGHIDMVPLVSVKNEIFRIIDDSGQLRDLPEIRAIRNSIRKLQQEIENLMHSYTTSSEFKGIFQSDIPVLRTNRQVLAVKANKKNEIKGIVHEVSQTGQTVFIEPDDVVMRNNDLIQEEFRLSKEITRILTSVTTTIAPFAEPLKDAHRSMIRIDTACAAARWGNQTDGTYAFDLPLPQNPQFRSPQVLKARHPLLGTKAVPITVEFDRNANGGKGHRVLIITGPNTGGKTVTLKTIALLCLLNQSGFPVPAAEGTSLPCFTGVYADIGDDQSIDESLSTFSGHMKNLAEILEKADENSLVLLDELGSGTDPQEGGAIAMAALDSLFARNSFVLVTTHHGILKNYGYTHSECINACVEFDDRSLAPTYRIIMGVPGESHALDIASLSGLPSSVLTAARRYIANNETDVSALIRGLNAKHEELSLKEHDIRQKEERVNDRWRTVDLKALRVKQHELELREQGYRKSQTFIEESRKMLENLVRELREGEITKEKTRKVKETIAFLEQHASSEKEKLLTEKENVRLNDSSAAEQMDIAAKEGFIFEPGMDVVAGEKRMNGTLVQKTKNDSWIVQVGSMRITVKEKDILPAKQTKATVTVEIARDEEPAPAKSRITFGTKAAERPQFELRLLGMRYEEAEKALIRQLDLCAIHGMKSFSIIHGKGNGVLQSMVQKKLSNWNTVAEFHFARPEEGGTGKTFVTMV